MAAACPGSSVRYADQDARTHLSFAADGAKLRDAGWHPEVDHEAAVRGLLERFSCLRPA